MKRIAFGIEISNHQAVAVEPSGSGTNKKLNLSWNVFNKQDSCGTGMISAGQEKQWLLGHAIEHLNTDHLNRLKQTHIYI